MTESDIVRAVERAEQGTDSWQAYTRDILRWYAPSFATERSTDEERDERDVS